MKNVDMKKLTMDYKGGTLYNELVKIQQTYRSKKVFPVVNKIEGVTVPWPLTVIWEAGFHTKTNASRDLMLELNFAIMETDVVNEYREKLIKSSAGIASLRTSIEEALSMEDLSYKLPDNIKNPPTEFYVDHKPEELESLILAHKTEEYYAMLTAEAQGIVDHCMNLKVFMARPESKFNSRIVNDAYEKFIDV